MTKPTFEFVTVQKSYTNGKAETPIDMFIATQEAQKQAYEAICVNGQTEYAIEQRGRKETIRPRWFNQAGTIYYALKHGNRLIEFNGGSALKVGTLENVPAAIDYLINLARTNKEFQTLIDETSKNMKRKK